MRPAIDYPTSLVTTRRVLVLDDCPQKKPVVSAEFPLAAVSGAAKILGILFQRSDEKTALYPAKPSAEVWRWQRAPEQLPVGANVIRVGAGDEEPSVNVTYDNASNVIRMVHYPPLPGPTQNPTRARRRR